MRKPLLYLAAVIMSCLPLTAATYEYRDGGLSLWLPDNWNVDITPDTLTGFAPGGEAVLRLVALPEAADLGAAFKIVPRALGTDITAYQQTQARHALRVGGMDGLAAGGEGIRGRRKQAVRVLIFKAPKAFVMLMWAVDAERWNQYKSTYERIESSIKPITRAAYSF